MEKAIYGMVQPFGDCYIDTNSEGAFKVKKTNRESVRFDSMVGMTLSHDFSKTIGTTKENLFVQVTDSGIYFKLIPNSPLGWSIYKKVKRAALRHCSLSFTMIKTARNEVDEKTVTAAFRSQGYTDKVIVEDYRNIRVYEICLTNHPANKLTFCTTNEKDPRLTGLSWDSIEPIPSPLIQSGDEREAILIREVEALAKDVEEYASVVKNL